MTKEKKPVKILLTAIFKDDSEYDMAERMLGYFMPYFDGLTVGLTGLSGNFKKLKKLLKKYKASIIEISPQTNPEVYSVVDNKLTFTNFAAARNAVFDHADNVVNKNKYYDWYSWADVDDILINGEQFREVAQMALDLNNSDAVYFTYWYSVRLKPDGSFDHNDVLVHHERERLLKAGMFKWISRLHEICVPKDGNYRPRIAPWTFDAENQTVAWAHITEENRIGESLDRNRIILEIQAREEEHKDPRTLFYLAKVYYDLNKPHWNGLAELLLEQYRELSGWPEEIANSWHYSGDIWVRRGDRRKALECYWKAMEVYPSNVMTYLKISREYSELGLSTEAAHMLDTASRMDIPKSTTTIGTPNEIKVMASTLRYNECIRKMDMRNAIYWYKISCETRGIGWRDDPLLDTLEKSRDMNDAAMWLFNYSRWLKINNHTEQLKKLLEAVAPEFRQEAFVQVIANEIIEPVTWSPKSVVYFAGSTVAEFDPTKAMENGVGGSETALIRLSEEWAKKDYEVTVYANVTTPCTHEGVAYKHWSSFNANDEFATLIIWRNPQLLDKDFKAGKIILDLHDVVSNLDFTEERLKKVDTVFVKSKYHRDLIPAVPDEKIVILSNGIDLPEQKAIAEKKQTALWYQSSYDRGLIHLLKMWPQILEKVPNATLDIAYGWDVFDSFFANNPERMAWREKMNQLMKQKGITHHGRVGKNKLRNLRAACGIWAYPTDFTEINCIGALEAQSDGTVPCVINLAALEETVQSGVKVDGDIHDPDVATKYREELISLMLDTPRWLAEAVKGEDFVKTLAWKKIAKTWTNYFV